MFNEKHPQRDIDEIVRGTGNYSIFLRENIGCKKFFAICLTTLNQLLPTLSLTHPKSLLFLMTKPSAKQRKISILMLLLRMFFPLKQAKFPYFHSRKCMWMDPATSHAMLAEVSFL